VARESLYTVGGTVQAGKHGIYLVRQADAELLMLCQSGSFAYVLTSRQMGKSSLKIRTVEHLKQEGTRTVLIELDSIGTGLTAEQWYLGLLTVIEDQLGLETDGFQWWQANAHLGFTQRLTKFFREVLLEEVDAPVVIFVDEIDTTLSLDFTDDFFVAIRFCYGERAQDSAFDRLTFVLIGVATPSDLIQDTRRTPFNIGQRVNLTDFTFEQARQLSEGFDLPSIEAEQVLRWVFKWTNGHPYLTQRLCQALALKRRAHWTEDGVDDVAKAIFGARHDQQDDHLNFIRDMLIKRTPNLYKGLATYQAIYHGKKKIQDEEQSLIKSHLKLSGIVCRHDDCLKVRNLIYKQIFDDQWIREYLPFPPRGALQRTVWSSLFVTLVTIVMRQAGVLQTLELQNFDQLMRLRPDEGTDSRVLIVEIKDEDNLPGSGYVSDQKLSKLLETLQSKGADTIGLSFYRDQTVGSGQERLREILSSSDRIIGAEGLPTKQGVSIQPPRGLSPDQVGFVDLLPDPDGYVRRILLGVPDLKGGFKFSFSLKVTESFLNRRKITLENGRRNPSAMRFNEVEIPQINAPNPLPNVPGFPIRINYGGYNNIDSGGVQTLLNFRTGQTPFQIVSVQDILSGRVPRSTIHDRVVLVGGLTDKGDAVMTSYSTSSLDPMPGVIVQAHAVSQILSAVFDKRPLMWAFPIWFDVLTVFTGAVASGMISSRFTSWIRLSGILLVSSGTLYSVCFIALLWMGCWLAFVPTLIASVITSFSIRLWIARLYSK
jgi:CHASE2 domain-containing sensor protein